MTALWFAPLYLVIVWAIYLAIWSWDKDSGSTTKSKEPWKHSSR